MKIAFLYEFKQARATRGGLLSLVALLLPLANTYAAVITLPGDTIGGGRLTTPTLSFTRFTIGEAGSSGNRWPSNETPSMAIDGITTGGNKYLNFAETNTGYIVTPGVGSSIVTGLFLSTGNDATERDPLTFSLYGSNSVTASSSAGSIFALSNFTPIVTNASTNLDLVLARNTAAPVQPTFTNTTAYTTYLLIFNTVRNSTAANSMQIGEASLTGSVVPETGNAMVGMVLATGLIRRRKRC